MPKEDDDALGEMLAGRIERDSDGDQQDREAHEADSSEDDGNSDNPSDGSSERGSTEEGARTTHGTENSQSTQITQQTDTPGRTDMTANKEATGQNESDSPASGAVRSRSPLPLYLSPELKAAVQTRFEKFNAQRTLNDEPQVQKHKHFMEGLLSAGLDHPDFEQYVLERFEDD